MWNMLIHLILLLIHEIRCLLMDNERYEHSKECNVGVSSGTNPAVLSNMWTGLWLEYSISDSCKHLNQIIVLFRIRSEFSLGETF